MIVKGVRMTLYVKLRRLRNNANLTQEEVATKLGVSRQTISKWESGLSIPQTEHIIEICKLYKITSDSLLDYHKPLTIPKIKYLALWLSGIIVGILFSLITLLLTKRLDETSSMIVLNSYGILAICLVVIVLVLSIIILIKKK